MNCIIIIVIFRVIQNNADVYKPLNLLYDFILLFKSLETSNNQ